MIYILPTGFRGPIHIAEESSAPRVRLVQGAYRLAVPASGYLTVHDLDFMRDWHSTRAFFEDGKEIATESDRLHPSDVALIVDALVSSTKADGAGHTRWTRAFVGTWPEAYEKGGLEKEPRDWQAADRRE